MSHFGNLRLLLRRPITSAPPSRPSDLRLNLWVLRTQSTNTEYSIPQESAGMNAYDILGVSQSSSFDEIKASFRKLAKETHPDLAQSQSHASKKFIEILAAYEILSDSTKRAHYDQHIFTQRTIIKKGTGRETIIFNYDTYVHPSKHMEVVEWLKWYRYTVKDILSERRITAGTGYFDILERDFYSALHAAYYGPDIESKDLLPDRFEAEERSVGSTSEVLHLVSGRDLFGMVCMGNGYSELPSHAQTKKLMSSAMGSIKTADNISEDTWSHGVEPEESKKQATSGYKSSDAYRDLELHVSGRVVAVAKRTPPKCNSDQDEAGEDQIHVHLIHGEEDCGLPLGVIKGLGTTSEEGTCYVYSNTGVKTHMIMKHRTLLVKHLHWFQLGEKASICECRCTRARLPPSKFWLFEPRSALHDIGGWYVETFGRDKKGETVPVQRFWDGFGSNEYLDKRLHPAVYLLALAYRTLDIEHAQSAKRTIKDRVELKMSRVYSWLKKKVSYSL